MILRRALSFLPSDFCFGVGRDANLCRPKRRTSVSEILSWSICVLYASSETSNMSYMSYPRQRALDEGKSRLIFAARKQCTRIKIQKRVLPCRYFSFRFTRDSEQYQLARETKNTNNPHFRIAAIPKLHHRGGGPCHRPDKGGPGEGVNKTGAAEPLRHVEDFSRFR